MPKLISIKAVVPNSGLGEVLQELNHPINSYIWVTSSRPIRNKRGEKSEVYISAQAQRERDALAILFALKDVNLVSKFDVVY